MPLKVKEAGKVWCVVRFPSSLQVSKTCIFSLALSQLTSSELVEVWRPGLTTGCLHAGRPESPTGIAEMSLYLSILTLLPLSWVELEQARVAISTASDLWVIHHFMAVTSASSTFLISFVQVKRKPSFALCNRPTVSAWSWAPGDWWVHVAHGSSTSVFCPLVAGWPPGSSDSPA